ncbi:hypothetical protein ACLOJK_032403 [Asimina triloba]
MRAMAPFSAIHLCNLVASLASSPSPRFDEGLRPFRTPDTVPTTYGQPTSTSSQFRPSTCSNNSESRLFRLDSKSSNSTGLRGFCAASSFRRSYHLPISKSNMAIFETPYV